MAGTSSTSGSNTNHNPNPSTDLRHTTTQGTYHTPYSGSHTRPGDARYAAWAAGHAAYLHRGRLYCTGTGAELPVQQPVPAPAPANVPAPAKTPAPPAKAAPCCVCGEPCPGGHTDHGMPVHAECRDHDWYRHRGLPCGQHECCGNPGVYDPASPYHAAPAPTPEPAKAAAPKAPRCTCCGTEHHAAAPLCAPCRDLLAANAEEAAAYDAEHGDGCWLQANTGTAPGTPERAHESTAPVTTPSPEDTAAYRPVTADPLALCRCTRCNEPYQHQELLGGLCCPCLESTTPYSRACEEAARYCDQDGYANPDCPEHLVPYTEGRAGSYDWPVTSEPAREETPANPVATTQHQEHRTMTSTYTVLTTGRTDLRLYPSRPEQPATVPAPARPNGSRDHLWQPTATYTPHNGNRWMRTMVGRYHQPSTNSRSRTDTSTGNWGGIHTSPRSTARKVPARSTDRIPMSDVATARSTERPAAPSHDRGWLGNDLALAHSTEAKGKVYHPADRKDETAAVTQAQVLAALRTGNLRVSSRTDLTGTHCTPPLVSGSTARSLERDGLARVEAMHRTGRHRRRTVVGQWVQHNDGTLEPLVKARVGSEPAGERLTVREKVTDSEGTVTWVTREVDDGQLERWLVITEAGRRYLDGLGHAPTTEELTRHKQGSPAAGYTTEQRKALDRLDLATEWGRRTWDAMSYSALTRLCRLVGWMPLKGESRNQHIDRVEWLLGHYHSERKAGRVKASEPQQSQPGVTPPAPAEVTRQPVVPAVPPLHLEQPAAPFTPAPPAEQGLGSAVRDAKDHEPELAQGEAHTLLRGLRADTVLPQVPAAPVCVPQVWEVVVRHWRRYAPVKHPVTGVEELRYVGMGHCLYATTSGGQGADHWRIWLSRRGNDTTLSLGYSTDGEQYTRDRSMTREEAVAWTEGRAPGKGEALVADLYGDGEGGDTAPLPPAPTAPGEPERAHEGGTQNPAASSGTSQEHSTMTATTQPVRKAQCSTCHKSITLSPEADNLARHYCGMCKPAPSATPVKTPAPAKPAPRPAAPCVHCQALTTDLADGLCKACRGDEQPQTRTMTTNDGRSVDVSGLTDEGRMLLLAARDMARFAPTPAHQPEVVGVIERTGHLVVEYPTPRPAPANVDRTAALRNFLALAKEELARLDALTTAEADEVEQAYGELAELAQARMPEGHQVEVVARKANAKADPAARRDVGPGVTEWYGLVARCKELGLPTRGKSVELRARIAEEEARRQPAPFVPTEKQAAVLAMIGGFNRAMDAAEAKAQTPAPVAQPAPAKVAPAAAPKAESKPVSLTVEQVEGMAKWQVIAACEDAGISLPLGCSGSWAKKLLLARIQGS